MYPDHPITIPFSLKGVKENILGKYYHYSLFIEKEDMAIKEQHLLFLPSGGFG